MNEQEAIAAYHFMRLALRVEHGDMGYHHLMVAGVPVIDDEQNPLWSVWSNPHAIELHDMLAVSDLVTKELLDKP